MNVVDSSAWLEYFAGTKNARSFVRVIEKEASLLVPTITLYEVFKKLLSELNEAVALRYVAHMKRAKTIDLDLELSLNAAHLSRAHKLPMADSIILATAHKYGATIWTQDADFKGLAGVRFFPKK